jgi:hypothetical protein
VLAGPYILPPTGSECWQRWRPLTTWGYSSNCTRKTLFAPSRGSGQGRELAERPGRKRVRSKQRRCVALAQIPLVGRGTHPDHRPSARGRILEGTVNCRPPQPTAQLERQFLDFGCFSAAPRSLRTLETREGGCRNPGVIWPGSDEHLFPRSDCLCFGRSSLHLYQPWGRKIKRDRGSL